MWSRVRRWLQTWGTLIVATVAMMLSGYAIYSENIHYTELTKPHTQHNEIYDRLCRLDERIERAQGWIDTAGSLGQDTTESKAKLQLAIDLRQQAETLWDHGDYADADRLIREAYDILDTIPQPPLMMYWWVLVVLIVGVLLAALLAVVTRPKREKG